MPGLFTIKSRKTSKILEFCSQLKVKMSADMSDSVK
jgi:hypothetical protein